MSVTVKAKLMRENVEIENRIFPLHEDNDDKHNFLRSKISNLFSMKTEDFRIFWKDSDGDMITVSSDEEIHEAMKSVENSYLRICIAENGKSENKEEDKNKPLLCGECKSQIYRKMFKCLVCPDFAICRRCEIAGFHGGHRMIKLSAPLAPWRKMSIKDWSRSDKPSENQFESFRQYRRKRCSGYKQETSRSYKPSKGEPNGIRCHRRKICERKCTTESWKQVKNQAREGPENEDKGYPLSGKGRVYGCTRRRRDPLRQVPELRRIPFENLTTHQDYVIHPFRRNHRTILPRMFNSQRNYFGRDRHHKGVYKTSEINRNNNQYQIRNGDGICGNKHRYFKDVLLLYPSWAVNDKYHKIGGLKISEQHLKDSKDIESHSITQKDSDVEEDRILYGKTRRICQRRITKKEGSLTSRCKRYAVNRIFMDIGHVRKCPQTQHTLRRRIQVNYNRKCLERPYRKCMKRRHNCPSTGRRISRRMGQGRVARKHPRAQPSVVILKSFTFHPKKRETYTCNYMKKMSRCFIPKRNSVRFNRSKLETLRNNVNNCRLLYRNSINRICQRRRLGRKFSRRGENWKNRVTKTCRTRRAVQGFCTSKRIRKCHRMHATLTNRKKHVFKGNNKRRLPCLARHRIAHHRQTFAMAIPTYRQRHYRAAYYNSRNTRRFVKKATRQCCRTEMILGHNRFRYGNIKRLHKCRGRRNGSVCSQTTNKKGNFRRLDHMMTKIYLLY